MKKLVLFVLFSLLSCLSFCFFLCIYLAWWSVFYAYNCFIISHLQFNNVLSIMISGLWIWSPIPHVFPFADSGWKQSVDSVQMFNKILFLFTLKMFSKLHFLRNQCRPIKGSHVGIWLVCFLEFNPTQDVLQTIKSHFVHKKESCELSNSLKISITDCCPNLAFHPARKALNPIKKFWIATSVDFYVDLFCWED